MRDLREELEEFSGEYAPSWQLEEGAIVVGKITGYSQTQTAYGEAWVCTIEEESQGPLSIWLTAKVLIDQFKKLRPKVGERIGIKCLGKHLEKGYWRFVVKIERPEQEPDFENIQAWDVPPEEADEDIPF